MNSPGSTVTDRGAALLEAAEANHRARREAGAEQLRIALEWATTNRRTVHAHLDEPVKDVRRIGASSYPVHEYASAELAAIWQMHPLAAQRLMADSVDLHWRLPHTWAAVQEGRLEVWVARKIVSLTKDLDLDHAQLVDERIADKLGVLPTGRLITVVEARVVEADREAAEDRWRQAASERTVHLGRETDYGTRNVFARLAAADAVKLDAAVDLVAGRLTPAEGETAEQRRARALGMLADPQAALDLLDGRDPRGGKAVVYVHTTREQLERDGVARVEDLGPMTKRMLQDLLAHAQITLKPVIDLADRVAADCYEAPASIAERLHLARPADVFPFAEGLSRRLDQDHTVPYDDTGPPGQTRPDNLGKLNRRHHRIKTHAPGWTVRRTSRGAFWWTSPSGRAYLVDDNGTRSLGRLEISFAA